MAHAPPYVDEFARNGLIVVSGLISEEARQALCARAEAIANGTVQTLPTAAIEYEPGRSADEGWQAVRKLNGCAQHDPVFRQIVGEQGILAVVEALLGPELLLFGDQLFMKPPGGVEKPYHQDSPYFPIEPMNLVSCWIALDETTEENGCLWFIPGSHTEGVRDHSEVWQVGDREDMRVPEALIERDREQAVCLRPGDCSFHHSLLLHRSGANRSRSSRRGWALHFMSASARWVGSPESKPNFMPVGSRSTNPVN